MLPDFLRETYATYKKDTDSIANWLATTAKRCGYSPEVLSEDRSTASQCESQSPAQPQSQAPRLKGRARKLARDAAAKDATKPLTQANSSPLRVYTIAIKSFITLASQIVAFQEPPVKVPAVMRKVLDRAISYRKKHHMHFNSHERTDPSPHNDGHAHFISVLERVRQILHPHMAADTASDPLIKPLKNPNLKEPDTSRSRNAYGELELEELSEEFLNAPMPENLGPSVDKADDNVRYQAERLSKAEEHFWGAFALLEKVWEIRAYLKRLWKMYRLGYMDLHAASITTNTATEIVRHLQEEYDKCFPEDADFASVVDLYYQGKCILQNQDPMTREHPDDIINMTMYDTAEELLIPTYLTLSSINRSITPGNAWIYPDGEAMSRDTSMPWSEKLPREKIDDDRHVLLRAFTSFTILAMMRPISDDELIRGVREMSSDKSVPLWFVFAVQIFLDIQHNLGPDVSRGFFELQKGARYLKSSINQNIAFHKDRPNKDWPAEHDAALPKMIKQIETWTERDVINDMVKIARGGRLSREIEDEPFYILKQYPVLCGIWLFTFRYAVQHLSILFAGRWNAVYFCAQLYNALNKEGLVGTWEDMESLILLQGVDKMFIGERPQSMEGYSKQWSLSTGWSVTTMAKNRRSDRIKFSTKGLRGLYNIFGMSELFAGRNLGGKRSMSTDLAAVEARIKSAYASEHMRMEFTEKVGTEHAVREVERQKAQARSKAKLNSTDFLEGLANGFYNEGVHLTFDYFRFHRFCLRILDDIRNEIEDDIIEPSFSPGKFIGHEQMRFPFLVGDIFMQAAEWDVFIKQKGKGKKKKGNKVKPEGLATFDAVFVKSAMRMQSAIKDQAGSMVCDISKRLFDYALVWGTGAPEETQWRCLADSDAEYEGSGDTDSDRESEEAEVEER